MLADYNDIQVIAVTASGILAKKSTVYTKENQIIHDDASSLENSQSVGGDKSDNWRANLVSMVYDEQHHFVETTITWPALKAFRQAKYEVTWQVKHNSMEITGHLYTERNIVALSLWHDALCEVQVVILLFRLAFYVPFLTGWQ